MPTAPETIQRAASFDWEALLPVVFFLLYGVAQFFGGKKKGTAGDEADEADVEAMERARQIREEIRRKIEERKKAAQGRTPAPASRPAYDPTLPDGQQLSSQPMTRTLEEPPARPVPMQPARPLVVKQVAPARDVRPRVEPAARGPDLEALLAKEHKRLENSRRKQREARAKVEEIERQSHLRHRKKEPHPVTRSGNFRVDLLTGLRHPDSMRQAILYREILGKPVGLK